MIVPLIVMLCCVTAAFSIVSLIESSGPDPYSVVSRRGWSCNRGWTGTDSSIFFFISVADGVAIILVSPEVRILVAPSSILCGLLESDCIGPDLPLNIVISDLMRAHLLSILEHGDKWKILCRSAVQYYVTIREYCTKELAPFKQKWKKRIVLSEGVMKVGPCSCQ